MAEEVWTIKRFRDTLRKKLEESGLGHVLRDENDKVFRKRSTTIGAIFVPRPPTQEELNRTPEEREARITQHVKELKELVDKAEEDADEYEDEDEAYPI